MGALLCRYRKSGDCPPRKLPRCGVDVRRRESMWLRRRDDALRLPLGNDVEPQVRLIGRTAHHWPTPAGRRAVGQRIPSPWNARQILSVFTSLLALTMNRMGEPAI